MSSTITKMLVQRWNQIRSKAAGILRNFYQHIHLQADANGRPRLCFMLTADEINLAAGEMTRAASYSTLPFAVDEARRETLVEELVATHSVIRSPPQNASTHQPTRNRFRDVPTWRHRNNPPAATSPALEVRSEARRDGKKG